ncbi:MAG TPA: diguanylate cyclase [Xanthomonadaceae bacterium]|nr:diguanylate cyclase [Xanthomonadaceae bacterium]
MTKASSAALPDSLALLSRTLVLALAIGLCCWWSIVYTRGPLGLSSLWVASGVLCGILLTSPRHEWSIFVLGAFAASVAVNFLHNGVGVIGIVLSVANTFEACLVALIVSARIDDPGSLIQIKRSVLTATLATLAACALSATGASLARNFAAPSPVPFGALFRTWFASHILGMAIFATLTIAARVEGRRLLGKPGRRLELVATLALVAIDCWLVFAQSRFAVTFLVFPPVLLCVFRHRFSGFVPATAIIALISTTQTAAGFGPFMMGLDVSDPQRTLMLQTFVASVCFLSFPMAAVLTERRLLMHRVAVREREYRLLADHSSDLVGRIGADDVRHYISPSVTEMLGWTREEFAQVRWDLIHADDQERVRQTFRDVFRKGADATVLFRMRHRDGRYLWLEVKARRVQDNADGAPAEIVYSGRDVTQRVEAEAALERLARHDPLTRLGNRLHFGERLELATARSRRSGKPLALLYLDIDRFKWINDSLGHVAGDAVLREFGVRLLSCLRETDFAARLGGDEFVVLIEDIDTPNAPQTIAEKLIANLRDEIDLGATRLRVTTSVGIAQGVPGGTGHDELMSLADRALYEAKAAGRNTWRMARPEQGNKGADNTSV